MHSWKRQLPRAERKQKEAAAAAAAAKKAQAAAKKNTSSSGSSAEFRRGHRWCREMEHLHILVQVDIFRVDLVYRTQPIAGASTNHKGIDFAAAGTPIYAAAAGTVISAGYAGKAGKPVE